MQNNRPFSTTSSANPRKRKPYIGQVVITGPEACPHCDAPASGAVVTFLTDQNFEPAMLDVQSLCRSCERGFEAKADVTHQPYIPPELPKVAVPE
jgi:hypothetical protein